ncbi:MAG: RNA polymerase sigma factor [Myxococcota bacterium]
MLEASALARLLRDCQPRVLGALVRRHRDLAACEDALQEALLAAVRQWPQTGVPAQPHAWLLQVASRRCTDAFRSDTSRRDREQRFTEPDAMAPASDDVLEAARDDSLDLFFHCCQPALTPASAVALTLRAVGGLTTAELAHAFLVPEATMGQRLHRARQAVDEAGLRLGELDEAARAARFPSVMQVLYLIFNEGYAASAGASVHRVDLTSEALRLTRLLVKLRPDEPEALGLLALMLLTDARRAARTGPGGELIPLDEQDRARWDQRLIHEGRALLDAALERRQPGPYQLQAAIAALHDAAPSTEATDWQQIAGLYELLLQQGDNPMVRLNLAIARAQLDGPRRGLELLAALEGDARLAAHHRFLAAKAHLLDRAGRQAEASALYLRAADATDNDAERAWLRRRAARA